MTLFRVNYGRYPLRTLGLQRTSSMEEYYKVFVDFYGPFCAGRQRLSLYGLRWTAKALPGLQLHL